MRSLFHALRATPSFLVAVWSKIGSSQLLASLSHPYRSRSRSEHISGPERRWCCAERASSRSLINAIVCSMASIALAGPNGKGRYWYGEGPEQSPAHWPARG